MAKQTLADILPAAPEPVGPLANYRMLSPTASVRVSPLCLGAMNLGDAWKGYMGECDKKTAFELLDYFVSQGGNFIDTANNYQDEQSEQWIGEWMAERGNRDQIVLATKYTTNYRAGTHRKGEILINYQGNGSKSLHVSVRDSLKKLKTDYIDLLWVHWWDYSCDVSELMIALNHLIASGKVLYLGISDAPAWVVSKGNEFSRAHGLKPFSVYQGRYSAASRDLEREVIPMARVEGMGICPWGALGGGKFKSEEQWKAAEKDGGRGVQASEAEKKVSKVLEDIAKRKGTLITSVAQAYVMHKTPYVVPIVGGRKVEHLKGNIEALNLTLSREEIDEIEAAVPFDIGFPGSMLWAGGKLPEHMGEVRLLAMGGRTLYEPTYVPIPAARFASKQ
ncbi:norsolorinic acid reductase [Microdochium trichocladiopsis]|uniref:Norsolorinic acid reductase n=1 Tax=Microdochium trichocladiopsis TaxID=1682393 RepID=A0A9P8XQX9_9PEZI|nr:norsolorinic acid reductase [Microdochium trichocladiopsis]KAH7012465.1 norsolorinic acid reductase [Microdochium trichocladiopsis]